MFRKFLLVLVCASGVAGGCVSSVPSQVASTPDSTPQQISTPVASPSVPPVNSEAQTQLIMSAVQKRLLYEEVDRKMSKVNPDIIEPIVQEWCSTPNEKLLDKLAAKVEHIKTAFDTLPKEDLTQLRIAAIGFKRVCDNRKYTFLSETYKVQNPNTEHYFQLIREDGQ
jgi:hypothetical protein